MQPKDQGLSSTVEEIHVEELVENDALVNSVSSKKLEDLAKQIFNCNVHFHIL